MSATKILQAVGLKPNDTIFAITRSGALNAFLEFVEEWELPIKIDKISKEDWDPFYKLHRRDDRLSSRK